MRYAVLLSVFVASALFDSRAFAGVIGPAKPSTLINVDAFFSSCPQGGKAFDGRTTSNGGNVSFVIPAKQVFVATSITAKVVNLNQGEIAEVFVDIQDANSSSNGLISAYTTPANVQGIGTVDLVLPTGVAFNPPPDQQICAQSSSGVLDAAKMYGYFTANR
jgi:hypothetical protein